MPINAEVNLVRNEITNYLVDLSTIQDKRKDVQETYNNAMHELDVKEIALAKTLARGSN